MRAFSLILLLGVLALPLAARADCSTGGCIAGGGKAETDCAIEFSGNGLVLNFPFQDPSKAKPKKQKEIRCFDGDAGCDTDGKVDGKCTFNVDLCLENTDPNLASCTPTSVTAVEVQAKKSTDEGLGLLTAVTGLVPSAGAACTSGETIEVPLKESKKGLKKAKVSVKAKATTAAGKDNDTLKLTCMPRAWPTHGYDSANTRANTSEDKITPANVSTLVEKWTAELGAPVTATPTVSDKLVYAGAWNGMVYAIDRKKGKVKWEYDTGSGGILGVQSSVTVIPDGRVVFGDSQSDITMLNGKNGKVLWEKRVGDIAVDHFWSSPMVSDGRVYVGVASHSDDPCTQGRLVALDGDSGAELWSLETVPDNICTSDTSVECTVDGDCPGSGTCVAGRGAGVTATVALDPTGQYVYMNVVGCFTYPSIGDSDSIFKVNAETGAVIWKTRVNPPEQFGFCSEDPTIDCAIGDACGVSGICIEKAFYHDYGFLNGPVLADIDPGECGESRVVVSGSKDGALYALKESDGSICWEHHVLPVPLTPAFAGFGLFNGAIGYADGKFYAGLNEMIPATIPRPDHVQAFDADDGSSAWSEPGGPTWSSVGLANGVLFVGSAGLGGAVPTLFSYDASDGTPLHEFDLPNTASSGPSVADGELYVGYGVLSSPGGVRAYELP